MMRRTRFAGVAGIVAMVMAVLAVCPCPAAMAASASEDAHGCCAGKAGPTVAPDGPSCCGGDAQDTQPAVSPLSCPLLPGWSSIGAVIVAAHVPLILPDAFAAAVRSAAPLILRV